MNLAKPQVSKKALTVVAVIALLGILAGSAGTYYVLRDNLDKKDPSQSAAPKPDNVSGQAPGLPMEQAIPEGTISATTIADKPSDYVGKEVKVRGRIIDTGNGKYILAGQENTKPGALNLDASGAGTDVTQFISGYTDPSKSVPIDPATGTPKVINAVTVTGKISIENQNIKLTATKIEL